jgi:AcrR family transcriptional regulator
MEKKARLSRRQLQAAVTRQDIVDSARRLFAQHGYAATSIAAIAEAAGVAVQTVYKTFGSKDAILLAMLDSFEAEAQRLGETMEFAAADTPGAQVRRVTAFHRALFDAGREIINVFRGAAYGDMGALWEEGGRRRRRAEAALIDQWHVGGHLRSGLSKRRAADVLWALTSPELYSLLVVQSGWSGDAYEEWLVDTLAERLLAPERT